MVKATTANHAYAHYKYQAPAFLIIGMRVFELPSSSIFVAIAFRERERRGAQKAAVNVQDKISPSVA